MPNGPYVETTEEMEIVMKSPPDNDFVNFQLGEFMFNVGVDQKPAIKLFDLRESETKQNKKQLVVSCHVN